MSNCDKLKFKNSFKQIIGLFLNKVNKKNKNQSDSKQVDNILDKNLLIDI